MELWASAQREENFRQAGATKSILRLGNVKLPDKLTAAASEESGTKGTSHTSVIF